MPLAVGLVRGFNVDCLDKFPQRIGGIFPLTLAVAGRLVLVPGIFLTIGALLGFRGVEFAGLIGVFASSTAVASFTMAQQMGGDAELAGDIVVVTSALCPFTIFGWILLFKSLGMF